MDIQRYFKIKLYDPQGNAVVDEFGNDLVIGEAEGYGISENSLKVEESLCADDLELGASNANQFEVQIYGLDFDVTGYGIYCYNEYEENGVIVSAWPVFAGTIESAKTNNKGGYRDIIAYDKMYFVRNTDVAAQWASFWSGRTTAALKDVRNMVCEAVGFALPESIAPLPNDGAIMININPAEADPWDTSKMIIQNGVWGKIVKQNNVDTFVPLLYGGNPVLSTTPLLAAPPFERAPFSTLIKMIGEVQCCCANVSREVVFDENEKFLGGYIEFILLGVENQVVYDVTDVFDTNDADFADYITDQPTGFAIYSTSDTITQMEPALNNTNPYPISGNVFLLNLQASPVNMLKTVLDVIQPYIERIRYTPAEIPMIISGETLKLGDKIAVVRGGATSYHFVFVQSMSGSLLINQTIESPAHGQTLNNKASAANDVMVLNGKYSKLTQDVDGLHLEVGSIDGRTTRIEGTIDGLEVRTELGTTTIGGDHVRTDKLNVHKIIPFDKLITTTKCYTEMKDNQMEVHLGEGEDCKIILGQSTANNVTVPWVSLEITGLQSNQNAIIQRYHDSEYNGIWIGSYNGISAQNSLGVFIDFDDNNIYRYVNGTRYAIADDDNIVARFG